eukprot:g12903.t1
MMTAKPRRAGDSSNESPTSGSSAFDNFSRNYAFEPANKRRLADVTNDAGSMYPAVRIRIPSTLEEKLQEPKQDLQGACAPTSAAEDLRVDHAIMGYIRSKPTEYPCSAKIFSANYRTAYLVKQYDDFYFAKCARHDADLRFLKNATGCAGEDLPGCFKTQIEEHAAHLRELGRRTGGGARKRAESMGVFQPPHRFQHRFEWERRPLKKSIPAHQNTGFYHKTGFRSRDGSKLSAATQFEHGRTFLAEAGVDQGIKSRPFQIRGTQGPRFGNQRVEIRDDRNLLYRDDVGRDVESKFAYKARRGESLNSAPPSGQWGIDRFFPNGRGRNGRDGRPGQYLSGFDDLDLASGHIECYSRDFSEPRNLAAGRSGAGGVADAFVSPAAVASAAAGLQVYHGRRSYSSSAHFDRVAAGRIQLDAAGFERSALATWKVFPDSHAFRAKIATDSGAAMREEGQKKLDQTLRVLLAADSEKGIQGSSAGPSDPSMCEFRLQRCHFNDRVDQIWEQAHTDIGTDCLVSKRALFPSYCGAVTGSAAHRKMLLVKNRFGTKTAGRTGLGEPF